MPNSRVLCLLAPLLITQAGCPLVGDLPERFDVAISASDSRESPKGSGPSGFAGSSWRIIRKSDAGDSSTYADISPDPYGGALGGLLERPPAGALIFVAEFAPDGRLKAVHENEYILPQVYDPNVPVRSSWTPSRIPLISFSGASYGMQVGNQFGLAVVIQVRLGFSYFARAVLYAWGTDDPDRVEGTFGYNIDFTGGLGDLVFDGVSDQYEFFAEPVE